MTLTVCPAERVRLETDRAARNRDDSTVRCGVAARGRRSGGSAPAGGNDERQRAVLHPSGGHRVREDDRVSGRAVRHRRRRGCESPRAVAGVDGDRRGRGEFRQRSCRIRLLFRLPEPVTRRCGDGCAGATASLGAVGDRDGLSCVARQVGDGDGLARDRDGAGACGRVTARRRACRRGAPSRGDIDRYRTVRHSSLCRRVGERDRLSARRGAHLGGRESSWSRRRRPSPGRRPMRRPGPNRSGCSGRGRSRRTAARSRDGHVRFGGALQQLASVAAMSLAELGTGRPEQGDDAGHVRPGHRRPAEVRVGSVTRLQRRTGR